MTQAGKYIVMVTDDNGWQENCPDSEGVFFGIHHPGTFIHHTDGGQGPVGHVEFDDLETATAFLRRMNAEGDWVAPPEVNPEGEESQPEYTLRWLGSDGYLYIDRDISPDAERDE